MKFYNFLLLTKSKSKKWLMRNKMGIKNVEMIIIKWERVWNDEREREREREQVKIHAETLSQATEESRASGVADENLQSQYLSWYHFFRKNEIRDYF